MNENLALKPLSGALYGAHWIGRPMTSLRIATIVANRKPQP